MPLAGAPQQATAGVAQAGAQQAVARAGRGVQQATVCTAHGSGAQQAVCCTAHAGAGVWQHAIG
jgi:hypothetical protein